VRRIADFLTRLPLGQQLALTACLCCLGATLILVALSATSSRYTQDNLQAAYGDAVVGQLAYRLSSELATGDRLGVAGELTRLADQPGVAAARALDVEGNEMAMAGDRQALRSVFSAPIIIAGDVAGTAEVSVDTQGQDEAQLRLLLALAGLAAILSFVVYGVTRAMAHHLARNIRALSAELAEVTGDEGASANEVITLRQRIAALPLELLKPSVVSDSGSDHYVETAISFVYFRSLPGYVDTVDEQRLQRYVATVHRMIYGAAGFYDGELEVVRQFGLAIYFGGRHPSGSAALRAASCAWLIQHAATQIETQLRLSVSLGLAVSGSELGRGDATDIYPGLYTQASLDELMALARKPGEGVVIADFISDDIDLTTRAGIDTRDDGQSILGSLADGHRDLLERQLQILLRALADQEEPQAGAQSE